MHVQEDLKCVTSKNVPLLLPHDSGVYKARLCMQLVPSLILLFFMYWRLGEHSQRKWKWQCSLQNSLCSRHKYIHRALGKELSLLCQLQPCSVLPGLLTPGLNLLLLLSPCFLTPIQALQSNGMTGCLPAQCQNDCLSSYI